MNLDDRFRNLLTTVVGDCAQHMGKVSPETIVENLRQGDETTRQSFCRGLGQEIAQFLGACDNDVKVVYLYDHTVEDAGADTEGLPYVLHLIVWAQPKTAALNSLIAILNRAMTRAFDDLIGDLLPFHLLDVQVVDDLEVKRRAGYASLLFSSRLKPLEVWKRESVSRSHALAEPLPR